MSSSNPRILIVDDEEELLRALQVNLRRAYSVETASSGPEALQLMAKTDPFAVIISDMRMPKMNGAQFLEKVRAVSPESTRVLLTGDTDLSSAVEAVNRGAIFRFLKKPCSTTELVDVLLAATEHHRLASKEQELLEKTLKGLVRLLTDLLGHAYPTALNRGRRIGEVVAHMCVALDLPDRWAFELAAVLGQLASVTVPMATTERIHRGDALAPWERDLVERLPALGEAMIENIPRLEGVAQMIGRQARPAIAEERLGGPSAWDPVILGGELLRLAVEFERLSARGLSQNDVYQGIHKHEPAFPKELLASLEGCALERDEATIASLPVGQLEPGMVIEQEVYSDSGELLASEGVVLDTTFLERLRNFDRGVGVGQPIHVFIKPSGDAPDAH